MYIYGIYQSIHAHIWMWMYVAYIHNACMHASMSIEINVLPLSNHMLFWCHSNYLWFGRVPCSEEEKVWMEQLLPWCAQEEVVACSISAPNLLRRPGINETPKYRFIRKLGNSSFACVCMCYMYVCAYVSMNVHMCVCMYVWMDLCMQVYMYACIVCVMYLYNSQPKTTTAPCVCLWGRERAIH